MLSAIVPRVYGAKLFEQSVSLNMTTGWQVLQQYDLPMIWATICSSFVEPFDSQVYERPSSPYRMLWHGIENDLLKTEPCKMLRRMSPCLLLWEYQWDIPYDSDKVRNRVLDCCSLVAVAFILTAVISVCCCHICSSSLGWSRQFPKFDLQSWGKHSTFLNTLSHWNLLC